MSSYYGRSLDNISNVEKLDNITFNGGTTYTLTKSSAAFTPAGKNNILISISGVVQQGNFSVSNQSIVFDSGVASSESCDFIMHYGTGLITTPADDTVSTAKIQNDAVTVDKLNLISTSSVPSLEAKGTSGVTEGYIQLNCAENSHGIKIKSAPHSANANYTLTLPNNDGDANQFLQTNGSGVLSFADAGGGAWNLLETETVSSATSGVVLNSMSSSYKTHAVIFDKVRPASNDDIIRHGMQLSNDNFIQGYTAGFVNFVNESGSASTDVFSQTATGYNKLADGIGNGSNEGFSGIIFYDSGLTNSSDALLYWGEIMTFRHNDTYGFARVYGRFANADIAKIQYGFNAGNVASGTFKLYGIS